MSDIVIMPKADYEAACNAIRARTGKTDLIKSGDLQAEIESITGGSSADVCYVTFMSHDGTVEYGKKAVAIGDDCADPIERGVFDTPTKESTVQYDYTFAGWTLEVDGDKNNAALQTVTEDRTVYAAYNSTTRCYNATFYDGDSVLAIVQVAYGGQATPPDTTKNGYTFDGWTPSDLTIYADTSFVGTWTELTGLYYITTVSDLPSGGTSAVAINRAGDRLAVAIGKTASYGYPIVYDLAAEQPYLIDTGVSSTEYYNQDCDYSYNDNYLRYIANYESEGYIHSYTKTYGIIYFQSVYGPGTSGKIACSPISDDYAYSGYSSSHKGDRLRVTATSSDIDLPGFLSDLVFSPNGARLAAAGTSFGVCIYDKASSALLGTINSESLKAKKVSYNSDGSKLAISYSEAPYVSIYETSTYTKICDLSEYITASGYAEFIPGTDMLVVGSGTTVRAFDVSGLTPQEILDIPTYSGGSIIAVETNHSGTRVVFLSADSVEVWGKY